MIRNPACSSSGPNQPFAPNSSTHTSPEITGDTETGSSISVINNARPANWNLPMHHAAASPQNVFTGTLIAATSKVSSIAVIASGSVNASATAEAPFDSACVNTTTSGR